MVETTNRLLAILFVAHSPVPLTEVARCLELPMSEIQAALTKLSDQLLAGPLRITHHEGKIRLVTAPDYSADIRQFLQAEVRPELSRPALETLAIVAYRGPLTRSAVEDIRGVSSEVMLRNLLARDLITEAGVAAEPGKPMRYGLSQHALELLGLTSLEQLPPFPVKSQDGSLA